ATRARRAPATAPLRTAPRRDLRVVKPASRRPRRASRRTLFAAVTLVVGSMLAVAGAQAYVTQGQVRLARLQQQLSNAQAHHRDLELQVAQLEDPASVVTKGQQQGLTVPAQVTDVPLVGHASPPPTTGNGR
ncbi:MAG TPA: hypothetical protein VE991_11120, partial [Acidimicrobiales bacterium]|nr:hypothetical protein [Acidimicrobiales bacterium]